MPRISNNALDADTFAAPAEGQLLGANGIRLLKRVSLLMLAGGTALLLNNNVAWPPGQQNFGAWGITCLGALSYGFVRGHRVALALHILLWGLLAVLLLNAAMASGLRTAGLAGLPFAVITAAWLLGLRAATTMAAISIATLLGFFIGEQWWGYAPDNFVRSPVILALVHVIVVLGTLAVAAASIRSFQGRLRDVWTLSRDLKIQVEKLRQSEERFSALFRANPLPSSTVDQDGRIIDVNDAWSALYGVRVADAIGKTSQELGVWTHAEEIQAVRNAVIAQGRVEGMPITLNTVAGVRPFTIYLASVEFGGEQRWVSSLLDQTDRQAAEAAQRSIHQALEARVAERTEELSHTVNQLTSAHKELVQSEKLASLGAMVAGISHELNTPIGNTLTVSSTLHSRVADFRKHVEGGSVRRSELNAFMDLLQQMADLISRSTERAAELISSFKQVAVDRSSERRREFDVQHLVEDIVMSLKPGMRYANVTIAIDVPTGIVCDSYPGPAGQVLTNLLQNAIIHAFTDREGGHIDVRVELQDALVLMTVRDNGQGMTEHTLKHAFDPFFTTRMGQGGSGLGLSVSHHIATNMLGGNLSATSEPARGCCFSFSFLRQAPALE